jgi:hypothetical protein
MWVKRTFTADNKTSYIDIPKEQFESVKQSQEEHRLKNKAFSMSVSKAPFWYPRYRYLKKNYDKAVWFIVGAITVEIIHLIFEGCKK